MSAIFNIGIDIGGTKINLSALDIKGKVVQQLKVSTKEVFCFTDDPLSCLASVIEEFCLDIQLDLTEVQCIVIGVPGKVDPKSQVITSCPNLKLLEGRNLSKNLSNILDIPVLVENDVNLITLGEQFQGAGKGEKDFACIYVGTGIGGGLILEGKLYVGADGAAGELGHVPIVPNGRLCTCGTKGCLEMYCSGKALAARANSVLSLDDHKTTETVDDLDWNLASEVFKAAREGHQWALEAIKEAFQYLGWGLVQLATIVNPRLILLGGGIINAWPEGVEIARKTFLESASVPYKDTVKIELADLKEDASFAGAYALSKQYIQSRDD